MEVLDILDMHQERDQAAQLTKKEVCASTVCKILVVIVCDIANVENVELRLATTTSDVDGKENWPCDAASDQTTDD